MSIWNTKTINEALGASLLADVSVSGVTTDSRKIKHGDIFIALKGDNFDGNKYALEAVLNGAALAIVDDKALPSSPQLLHVDDAYQALLKMAEYKRNNSQAKFIGVTGSVGKTTVKEALGLVLSKQGKTHVTVGNLNNHIGLPLTLANLPDDTKFAIIELGMNHSGEISFLTKICRPHIALITYIAAVHIEFFENVNAIALAKAEIFEGIEKGAESTAILPADNEYFQTLVDVAKAQGISNIIPFGQQANAWQLSGPTVTAKVNGEQISFTPEQTSVHFINNLLSVLTAVAHAGADLQQAAHDISAFTPPKGRGKLIKRENGAIIIDDAYNASPESMRAALNYLGTFKPCRTIALLGDMRELGANAQQYHESLSDAFNHVDMAFFYGENMLHLYNVVKNTIPCLHFEKFEDIEAEIANRLEADTVLLIKGSNGTGLWKIVEKLS